MSNFSSIFGNGDVKTTLNDNLYEAQRERLAHTSAAEHSFSLSKLYVERKARLENELAEMLIKNPLQKKKLFGRVKIETLITDELKETQKNYLKEMMNGEHHLALAVMFANRIERLQAELHKFEEKKVETIKTKGAAQLMSHAAAILENGKHNSQLFNSAVPQKLQAA